MSTSTTTPNPVTWFEIHTADPDRAKDFYGHVFGWEFDDSLPGYTMISQGDGAPIGGGIAATDGKTPNDVLFLVQVPDVGRRPRRREGAWGLGGRRCPIDAHRADLRLRRQPRRFGVRRLVPASRVRLRVR